MSEGGSTSSRIREGLDHPVIDGDGHTQEFHPEVVEYFREVAGPELTDRYVQVRLQGSAWQKADDEERMRRRISRPPFWNMPAKNTLDLATAMLPELFRVRLDDMGIDYAVVYTSQFHFGLYQDSELRRAGCRAVNLLNRDRFAAHADRMTPAAVIPMHTPEEAIEELEFCVQELGYKAIMVNGVVTRPVKAIEEAAPAVAGCSQWVDCLGLDSAYDYDPFWRRCVELKVAPTAHSSGQRWGSRQSISSYTYNHLGAFAQAGEAFCKALFLGGVMRRFPDLRVAFLEGGVNWAVSLYNDIVEHWEKRNIVALKANLDPAQIDRSLLAELVERYGGPEYAGYLKQLRTKSSVPGARPDHRAEDPSRLDEWVHTGITEKEDIYSQFVPRFFFGCEADDRTVAHAFNARCNHGGARLNALFSSDVSHWDVSDMTETLSEAYELVEDGLMSHGDFRDFTFTNMVRLHGGMNPDFFKGTVVEDEAEKVLALETAA